ncbi:hypothetical protein FGIG_03521 [Fasciola gigantica]|uniref:Uncharacterized protein n=1 Tax=Fasciola gigantica TaxID=46835 RepID=A0A504YI14_FASGI|nr:hypothetical protein FGIG_03521 [Fasciola gigantica]
MIDKNNTKPGGGYAPYPSGSINKPPYPVQDGSINRPPYPVPAKPKFPYETGTMVTGHVRFRNKYSTVPTLFDQSKLPSTFLENTTKHSRP